MGQTCGECTNAKHHPDTNFTDGEPRVNCRHLQRDLLRQPLNEPIDPNRRPIRKASSECPYDPSRFEPRLPAATEFEAVGSFRSTPFELVQSIRTLLTNYIGVRRSTR